MAKKRVIIQSNATSPFRVSVIGVDASGAQFNNLIFDGNQPPLRLWATGYVQPLPLGFSNPDTATFADSAPIIATPSGKTPIYFLSTRQPLGPNTLNPGGVGNGNCSAFITYNSYGEGGLISIGAGSGGSNLFTGMNFNRDSLIGNQFSNIPAVVNFAIMKNYQ